jgi:pyrroloquinoline quinone biosynthesis protein B
VPLYLEDEGLVVGAETDSTIGLEVSDGTHRFYYVPGCAEINERVERRLRGAELVFFDGTTFTDDEMVALGLSSKTAWRMGHVAMSGEKGSVARLAGSGIARKIYIHINNTNPVLVEDSDARASVERAGWEVGFDGMEVML